MTSYAGIVAYKPKYPELIKGTEYENAEPLSIEVQADGKSMTNPSREGLAKAYGEFPDPLDKGQKAGFDVHIYYFQERPEQKEFARSLWERIRREFPELRVYRFWEKPIGPHPIAMFEVNLFTPAQFGAFIPWLMVHRGPLSALLHPNTGSGNELYDHTLGAAWLGERVLLDTTVLHGPSGEGR